MWFYYVRYTLNCIQTIIQYIYIQILYKGEHKGDTYKPLYNSYTTVIEYLSYNIIYLPWYSDDMIGDWTSNCIQTIIQYIYIYNIYKYYTKENTR